MNLQIGSRGDSVKFLQSSLNFLVPGNPIVVDGIFGNLTRSKLIEYQRSRNLVPDGIAGPITQRKISDDIKKLPNPQAVLTDPGFQNNVSVKQESKIVPALLIAGLLFFVIRRK